MVHKQTTRSPRQKRKRAERRDAILKTALELVIEDGLDGLTIHGLARALDYSPGALYRYFPSKAALLAELQRQALEDIHGALTERRATLLASPAALKLDERQRALLELLSLGSHYAALLEVLAPQLKLISALFGDPRPLLPDEELARVAPAFLALFLEVDGLFTAAKRCGALTEGSSRERTLLLWSSVQGVLQLNKMLRFEAMAVPLMGLVAQLNSSLLLGWGARPDDLAAAREVLIEGA